MKYVCSFQSFAWQSERMNLLRLTLRTSSVSITFIALTNNACLYYLSYIYEIVYLGLQHIFFVSSLQNIDVARVSQQHILGILFREELGTLHI